MRDSGRILLVEDDPGITLLIQTVLGRLGHSIDAVSTGTEALAQLRWHDYDVILLDLVLPRFSGFDVLDSIRSIHPTLVERVIVVSAAPEPKVTAIEQEGDVWACLRKPFEIGDLTTLVEACVAFARYRRLEKASGDGRRLERLSNLLEARNAVLARPSRSTLRLIDANGYPPEVLRRIFPMPLSTPNPLAAVCRTGEPLWLAIAPPSIPGGAAHDAFWDPAATRAAAALPIHRGPELRGVACWSWGSEMEFDSGTRTLVEHAARELAADVDAAVAAAADRG